MQEDLSTNDFVESGPVSLSYLAKIKKEKKSSLLVECSYLLVKKTQKQNGC